MNKLNNTGKFVIAGVVAVIAIVLIVVYGGGSQPAQNGNTGNPTQTPATTTTQNNNPAPAGTTTNTGSTKPPLTIIGLVTPVPGVTWKIGTANVISWEKEGGSPGQIELLNATSKDLIGVILTSVGPHQTSYSWNTRDLYLGRTNPAKTTVVPGRYIIKISFDGNNIADILSQPITISQ